MEQETKLKIRDAIFLVLLLAAIIGLFSAVITIRNYGTILKNPMGTCMAQFNLNTCVCYEKETNYPVTIKSINYTEFVEEEDIGRDIFYNLKGDTSGARGAS